MKKITSLLLTLAMLLGLLQTTALAATYEISYEETVEQVLYTRTIKIEETVGDGSITIEVSADSYTNEIDTSLAAYPMEFSIPCESSWTSVSVTYAAGGDTQLARTLFSNEGGSYVSFYVHGLDTYTITNTTDNSGADEPEQEIRHILE